MRGPGGFIRPVEVLQAPQRDWTAFQAPKTWGVWGRRGIEAQIPLSTVQGQISFQGAESQEQNIIPGSRKPEGRPGEQGKDERARGVTPKLFEGPLVLLTFRLVPGSLAIESVFEIDLKKQATAA